VRQLADGRGLAGAVDADDQHDAWRRRRDRQRLLGPGEHLAQLLDDASAQSGAARRAIGDRLEDPRRGGDADISADPAFWERAIKAPDAYR